MNKKYILLIITMLILVVNPKTALDGAVSGLSLWFDVILPTLLPYMIISYLIQNVYGSSIQNPLCYIITIGLTCGFPMGAYATTSMYSSRKINRIQAYLLLMCCNISSPAFVISYITMSSLKLSNISPCILLINYIPTLLIIIYLIINNKSLNHETKNSLPPSKPLNFETLDEAITTSISNVLKLCGYIIIFSILAQFIAQTHIANPYLKCIIIGVTEITTGINYAVNSGLCLEQMVPIVLFINAFGGLSCIFQSATFIRNTDLDIKKYMYSKILLALLTLACWYLLVHVLNFPIIFY